MEIKRNRNRILTVLLVTSTVCLLSACAKKFWEYDCSWVSEEPYIYITQDHDDAKIQINGQVCEVNTAWKNDGTGIYFYEKNAKKDETEDVLWETKTEIKSGRMYLTIVKDNVSDYEGKTFVLEQHSLREESTHF